MLKQRYSYLQNLYEIPKPRYSTDDISETVSPFQHHRIAPLTLHTISVDVTYTHSAAPNYMEMSHQLNDCAILISKTNPDHQFYSRLSEPRNYAEDKGKKKNLNESTAHPAHGHFISSLL
jgi:hypothetical protein